MLSRRRILLPKRYIGPGDIVPGATAWYSPARAYSRAFSQQRAPVMDLQKDPGGTNPITIYMLPNGFVDLNAIANWVAVNSVATIRVAKLYDQAGNGFDVVQATLANMPILTLSAINGLPAITFAAGSGVLATAASVTLAQPISMSGAYVRTGAPTISGQVIGAQATIMSIGPGISSDFARAQAGAAIDRAATEGAWHSMNAVLNGASSAVNIDGADSGAAAGGANTISSSIRLGRSQGGVTMTGSIIEAGMWPPATPFTAAMRADLNTNQHGTFGYNF